MSSFTRNVDSKTTKKLRETYTFIPSGTLLYEGNSATIQSFVISQGEVTNFEYLEFLMDLRMKGEQEKLAICQVDSAKWMEFGLGGEGIKNHYFSHPAYRNYPVVNITKEAAQLYCAWLTEKFAPNQGESKLLFRLPSHEEWLYTAKGGSELSDYAWGSTSLQNAKGNVLCNYMRLGAENVTRDAKGDFKIILPKKSMISANQSNDLTAPSKSYWPNKFGVYNMNGNVAEMISGKDIVVGGSWHDPGYDVRNESYKTYKGAGPTIGFRVVATALPNQVSWLKTK